MIDKSDNQLAVGVEPALQENVFTQKNKEPQKHKFNAAQEIRRLNDRLDSQSNRISELNTKLSNICNNQKHYLSKRLPKVLEREEARSGFVNEYNKVKTILKEFGKQRFFVASNSKNPDLKKQRYIGMFTHVEMQRLRRLLAKDLRIFKLE